jgi:hypothetical protein
MTSGYLIALRQSIRICEKSEISEKSPAAATLNSLNSLISHPGPERNGAESAGIPNFQEPITASKRIPTQKPAPCEKSEISEIRPSPYEGPFRELERRCPEFVEAERWQQAVDDGHRFLASWGEQAHSLGWAARDLFGLHQPLEHPSASYNRLSRYDEMGLIWLLRKRVVVELTETAAAIRGAAAVLVYRRRRGGSFANVGVGT